MVDVYRSWALGDMTRDQAVIRFGMLKEIRQAARDEKALKIANEQVKRSQDHTEPFTGMTVTGVKKGEDGE